MSFRPLAGVTLHNGQPIPEEMDFFWPPPEEIGVVLSAVSELKKGKEPMPMAMRVLLGLLVLGVLAFIGGLCGYATTGVTPYGALSFGVLYGVLIGAGFGLICGGGLVHGLRFTYVCTYVGELGVARGTIKKSRQNAVETETLMFANAANLYTSSTHMYSHGIYTGSNFDYTWADGKGVAIFKIASDFSKNRYHKRPKNAFNFALGAEKAWTRVRLEAIVAEAREFGAVKFTVGKYDYVTVGEGYFELRFNAVTHRLATEEIGSMTLNEGVFTIKSKDAKWYSGEGKFSFGYGSMANVQAFLIWMEKVYGVKFG
jgi:hypothetical protein